MKLDRVQSEARNRAVHIFQHYIGLMAKNAGVVADSSDLDAEIESAVDDIIAAATPARTEHETAVAALLEPGTPDPRD
jgi:isocitrate dehydrogenase kinase/phosphatase